MSLQRNVHQQNELAFEAMLSTAKAFREHGVAPGVDAFLESHGINLKNSAVVWAQTDSYMLGFKHGLGALIVTPNHKFFKIELELTSNLSEVIVVHEFANVSAEQNTSEHNRGTGKGGGALAIMVLDAVNAT